MAGLCVAAGGCSDRLATAPVEGKVLYRGKPLQFGSVTFQPDLGLLATGIIGPDGSFRLSTYSDGDGAVIGTHQVRITCFESQAPNAPPPDPNREQSPGRSLIPRKYAGFGTSDLQAEVGSHNTPIEFELTD